MSKRSEQETEYLLSTQANRAALQKGMKDQKGAKIFTPNEWAKFTESNNKKRSH